jgi:hypothetical protein
MNEEDYLTVPPSILVSFFDKTAEALDKVSIVCSQSLFDIRHILLKEQLLLLEQVVDDFNNDNSINEDISLVSTEKVRNALKDVASSGKHSVIQAMNRMNESARLAFARLALQSEDLRDIDNRSDFLISSQPMKREDLLEFFGLCTVSLRLPNVREHILNGTPLFNGSECIDDNTSLTFPDQRFNEVQRMILRAIGYDPEHAVNEINCLLYLDGYVVSHYKDDEEVTNAISQMTGTMNILLRYATIQSTNDALFSERNCDGCTRVVSVTYTEKLIDEESGKDVAIISSDPSLAPSTEVMEDTIGSEEVKQIEELRLARDASRLQQEILDELLTMRDEERESMLDDAKKVSNLVLSHALTLPTGSERILFLQSIEEQDKKRMMMHKLWNNMLQQHGGKPPITSSRNFVD